MRPRPGARRDGRQAARTGDGRRRLRWCGGLGHGSAASRQRRSHRQHGARSRWARNGGMCRPTRRKRRAEPKLRHLASFSRPSARIHVETRSPSMQNGKLCGDAKHKSAAAGAEGDGRKPTGTVRQARGARAPTAKPAACGAWLVGVAGGRQATTSASLRGQTTYVTPNDQTSRPTNHKPKATNKADHANKHQTNSKHTKRRGPKTVISRYARDGMRRLRPQRGGSKRQADPAPGPASAGPAWHPPPGVATQRTMGSLHSGNRGAAARRLGSAAARGAATGAACDRARTARCGPRAGACAMAAMAAMSARAARGGA